MLTARPKILKHSWFDFCLIKFNLKDVQLWRLQKPSGSIETKRNYIDSIISKLEYHKTKNLDFLRYYSQGDTHLDRYYFLRGNDNLTLISDTSHYYTDPEFSTSHDNLAAQVISYDLLSNYYQLELKSLRKQNENSKSLHISKRHPTHYWKKWTLWTEAFKWH